MQHDLSSKRYIPGEHVGIRAWGLMAISLLLLGPSGADAAEAQSGASREIAYNRDIRPILADHCLACHGPDKNQRQADLRLDERDAALASGAIVPGRPDESSLIARIDSTDADFQMPPAAAHKPLDPGQRKLLRQWIAAGAEYQPHWAYMVPVNPPIPTQRRADFSHNTIDAFILERLAAHGLVPADPADRRTLIRRLSLDLTGLPPTWTEVDAFVHDDSPQAYEQLVDRLLDSPHFGERMAIFWLDIVRFADTIGYHSDNPMQIYPYRDYVIRSFNDNKPFDQFTREQLAGDLLDGAQIEEKIASAYNRLLQTTEEGGAQAKEYEAKYAADRVRNVGSAWLGVTLGCCQCHDHKYDPFTMRDFYGMAAFFADIQEPAVGGRGGGTMLATPEQSAELQRMDEAIVAARRHFEQLEMTLAASQWEWESTVRAEELPEAIRPAFQLSPEQRSPEQRDAIRRHRLESSSDWITARDDLAQRESRRNEFVKSIPHCLTTESGPARTVRILPRGNWLDESGEIVAPATPAVLTSAVVSPPPDSPESPASTESKKWTRRDLADWIVAADNPLTARVFVNRVWKIFFGAGLTRSLEDIGLQGELPSHPELLDWLAVDFVSSGWEMKRLIKQIVMSGTYRQSSLPRPELHELDPQNRLLARQNRFRVDAEIVRDNALAISGLLNGKIGGPSVKPYQPAGYWVALNFPTREWENDPGEGLYRRGLYTHWQRSFLHPSLLAFDAPPREECVVDRPRSNLPQQALTLLNDPTYVEAARGMGERIVREGGTEDSWRLVWAMQTALQRPPSAEEATLLAEFQRRQLAHFQSHLEEAHQLLKVGARPVPTDLQPAELAAWTATARVLLNLHETITRF